MFVVEEAAGTAALETRLNTLESRGFDPNQIILLGGLSPQFIIVACRSGLSSDTPQPGPPKEQASTNQPTTRLSPAELVERWKRLA
jgi:hypothetical protein